MANSVALKTFYRMKPLLPRRTQIVARRLRAALIWRQLDHDPCAGIPSEPLGYSWPDEAQACALLTHDIELEAGQENVWALAEIEEEHGLRSCWDFVVRRYDVDVSLIARLLARGHEVGVHGVYHDGREFESQQEFDERLAVMTRAATRWGATGFRSPSLLYEREMLETIPFSWDSSMPAWDPFQPKPGDCLKFVPFDLNDRCVELPVTLWQDFTLFEELGMEDIAVWRKQVDAIYSAGGLINVIVHPDYALTDDRLELYRQLVEHLTEKDALWITTPSEVAEWHRSHTAAGDQG